MRAAFFVVLALSTLTACEPSLPSAPWPDLPTEGFFTGRAAVTADVVEGRAFFMGDSLAPPTGTLVPQYATLRSADGTQHRGVVLQTERSARGSAELAALRLVSNGEVEVVPLDMLVLHGQEHPR